MKGILNKTDIGWMVSFEYYRNQHSINPHIGRSKLHPDDVMNLLERFPVSIELIDNKEVEFDFVEGNYVKIKYDKMSKQKLRPCDCKDSTMTSMLDEQGIGINDESITVMPNYVLLTMGHTTIKIPMARFKMFAEWYLEEQEINKY